ncbi:PKD domain-containing protein [Pricia sp.]|uniref:PKD domain-containing protein n=1 Tax=Pricia sp. TaxID=2268138 RepID=UPI0035942020
MIQFYARRSLLPCLITVLILTFFSYAQSFNSKGLNGVNLENPTSLDFGPNGKLYVSQQDGTLFEYTIVRNNADAGQGSYNVADTNVISVIKTGVPNHNDDGSINTSNTRQVTGLLAAGTASVPVLYVSSSDSRIGGGPSAGDSNLDTNSGTLSRLTWTGSTWDKVDLVRGLSRCEENHSTNGMDIFERNGNTYLLLLQGGNANKGAPSNNFAGTSETFLSASLLIVNLTQLENMETANGGPFLDTREGSTKYIYDLPTLNDPDRTDITNSSPDFPYPASHPLYNATIDLGDPFGGNNGLNQAFPEPGGPVQIFSPGYRNAYDVVVTSDGRIFTSDNGPNTNWGGQPLIYTSNGTIKSDQTSANYNPAAGDYITNDFNEANSSAHGDALHYVGTINDANGTYYGGHPVPTRAFPSRAGIKVHSYVVQGTDGDWIATSDYNFGDLLTGVTGYFNTNFAISDFPDDPRQGAYLSGVQSDPRVNILDVVKYSTNGMCEYTASNFGGAMKGNILSASYASKGYINRYQLDANGTGLGTKNNNFLGGFGAQPLDVIAQGDSDIFPGTVWAATYGANNITVFEPSDFAGCLEPTDPGYVGTEDYDSDGYSNDDEVANGTDICSGGSKPTDSDDDSISDLNDDDDDNDGIADVLDAFALDPDNGTTTNLPIIYPFWNNDPGTGLFGLGFTGLMLDPSGTTDYLDQLEENNLTFGGAGGKATIDAVSSGDARGASNTQDYAFQVGVNVDSNSEPFTAHTKIETPFAGITPVSGLSYGMYLGNGDQDHYLKVAITEGVSNTDDIYGFEVVLEDGSSNVSVQTYDVANVIKGPSVDIYISVNPAANMAQPYYSIDGGENVIALGSPVTLPASLLNPNDNQGMAVGIISTSAGPGPEFTATWDFLNVTEDGAANLALSENPLNFGVLKTGSGQVQLIPSLTNEGGPSTGAIQITDISVTGVNAALFESKSDLPMTIGPNTEKTLPLNFYPNTNAGTKTANLVIEHTGDNSPFIIPLQAVLTNDVASSYMVIARVNAGGADVSATDGKLNWETNVGEGAVNGINYTVNTGKIPGPNNTFLYENRHASVPVYIDEATFNALYLKERYDASSGPEMEFKFPVANGDYTVNIFTGNGYEPANSVGARMFDISLEGEIKGDNIDVVALYGGSGTEFHAGMLAYDVKVIDGELNVLFEHGANENPVLQAIEIMGINQGTAPISVASIADQIYQVNEGSVLAVSATGGSQQENFTYTIFGQPNGIDIEPTNGQIFGNIAEDALLGGPNNDGVHQVTVTVSKPGSQIESIGFTWSVVNLQWTDKNENQNYTARHECSLVQVGDKFYLMGGRENATTIDIYDYETDTWSQLVDSPPVAFNHFQATEYQGLIWVIGAFTDNGFPSEQPAEYVWAFDPANQEWIQGPEIPVNRRRGSAGLIVYNDKFYISGGNTIGHNGGYVNWFDEYDPATGEWTPLADAPHARDHFHAGLIDGKMYMVGGRLSGDAGGVFNPTVPEVDVYDFANGTWSTLPTDQNLPTPRAAAAVANLNGKLLVIGGEVNEEIVDGNLTTDALAITEQYDPVTQTWKRLPNLNHKRHGTQAIVSGNGVFVLAGSDKKGAGRQKNMEYLGDDNPVGVPSTSSTFTAPDIVDIETDTTVNFNLQVRGGNTGIFIRSMQLSGLDAVKYRIVSGGLENSFLSSESAHGISVSLTETGQNTSALLTIDYGAASTLKIILKNGELSSGFDNPGTQYNKEGDEVSLPIQIDGNSTDFTYTATGLPPILTMDADTGIISGTVSSGENNGPFLEENGLVVIEAESGEIVPGWTETNAGGATGIIAGTNSFNSIDGGTIPYQVTVTNAGVYRFNWRSFYSGISDSDENDNWLRFPNNDDVWFFGYKGNPIDEASIIDSLQGEPKTIVFPKGSSRITPETTPKGGGSNGFFNIYRSSGDSEVYDWQAKTFDDIPYNIYVWFVNPGTYTFEVSERSAGHAIDKMALYKIDGANYSDTQLTATAESDRGADGTGSGVEAGSPYQVAVTVTNKANVADTTMQEFTWIVDNSGKPLAYSSATPLQGEVPLEVSFLGSRSVDDIAITDYLWEFGDALASTSDLADTSFTFMEAGRFNVTLTVTDAEGQTDSETLEIVVDPKPIYSIFASAGANGTISPEGQIEVVEGEALIITINPDTGYFIADIQVDGIGQMIADSYIFENVSEAHTISVSFETITHAITASTNTGGTISPEGIINVLEGGSQSFTAVADAGYSFDHFIVDGNVMQNVSEYIFENVTEAHVIEAVFAATSKRTKYTIKASANTGGELSPSGSVDVFKGEAQTFAIVTDDGFEIIDMLVDGISVETAISYTFENVEEDHSFEVVFAEMIPNDAPIAVAVSDVSESFAPLTVTFDGSSSSDDKGITNFSWNFGDGSIDASGERLSHTYTNAGTFTATLTVEDEAGEISKAMVVITVKKPLETDDDFRVFPNPASITVTLKFIKSVELKNIYVYNMQGRLMKALDAKHVKYEDGYTFDVSRLSEGMYFISTEDQAGNEYHRQMIIKR